LDLRLAARYPVENMVITSSTSFLNIWLPETSS